MHDALVGLLDKVDTAVAESVGALDRTEVESVAALARATRVRLAYPDSIVVEFGIDEAVIDQRLIASTGDDASAINNNIISADLATAAGCAPRVGGFIIGTVNADDAHLARVLKAADDAS